MVAGNGLHVSVPPTAKHPWERWRVRLAACVVIALGMSRVAAAQGTCGGSYGIVTCGGSCAPPGGPEKGAWCEWNSFDCATGRPQSVLRGCADPAYNKSVYGCFGDCPVRPCDLDETCDECPGDSGGGGGAGSPGRRGAEGVVVAPVSRPL